MPGNEYTWCENQACVATYNVLEGDMFLDQFDDLNIPFSEAAAVKMRELRYFPQTTNNPNLLEILSLETARKFVRCLQRVFTVSRQDRRNSSADIVKSIANIFENGDKTILDLARVVDQKIKFPEES